RTLCGGEKRHQSAEARSHQRQISIAFRTHQVQPRQGLPYSQRDGDLLKRPLALALAEEIEPERADALRRQQGCQSLVGLAVLVGKEAVTEHGDAVRLFLRRRQDSRDLVPRRVRSEEHTSELQSPDHLVCRLLLEKQTSGSARSRRR